MKNRIISGIFATFVSVFILWMLVSAFGKVKVDKFNANDYVSRRPGVVTPRPIGDELNLDNVKLYLDSIGVHHSHIVVKQAILETGWLKSYSATNRRNLFGLTNGKTRQLFVFDHWKESCIGYKNMVQYKYERMGYDVNGNDQEYYNWLVDVHYASDPKYISKLKNINYE